VGVWQIPSVQSPYNFEVLGGFLIGFPIVALVTRIKPIRIDEALGNISYGVFLNHFLLIWTFQVSGVDTSDLYNISFLIVCSFLLSWLTYRLVERPVVALRYKMRKAQSNNIGDATSPQVAI